MEYSSVLCKFIRYSDYLGRCSAASLDVLAGIFKNDILQVLLPCIQETLSNPDWRVKESGILALGAIAEGCMEGVRPHLPQLIPFLLQTSTEKKPLVRSISCWTLSRYCTWVVDEAKEQFMEPLIMVVSLIELLPIKSLLF